MKKKMVNYEIDSSNPPANDSSAESGVEGAPGQAGNKIDCSDIPPLQEDFWKKAVPNPFYRQTKTSTTVRIDSDVLHWLRAHGSSHTHERSGIDCRSTTSVTARYASPIAASVCGLAAASAFAIVIRPKGCRAITQGRSGDEVYTHSSGS